MSYQLSINHPSAVIFLSSLILNALLWTLSLFLFPYNDPSAILHYSVGVGIDFIGEGRQIITLPICGLILIVGNFILGTSIKNIDKTVAYTIWSVTPIIQIILIAAFALVYFANH